MPGYKNLTPSQEVQFTFEAVEQDGYRFRAVEVWPPGVGWAERESAPPHPSDAHRSSLSLRWDEDPHH